MIITLKKISSQLVFCEVKQEITEKTTRWEYYCSRLGADDTRGSADLRGNPSEEQATLMIIERLKTPVTEVKKRRTQTAN